MDQVPSELRPSDEEGAVLSLLAVDAGDEKLVRAGSLITVPLVAAGASWKKWGEMQPATRPHMRRDEADLGPSFDEEPFPGIHIQRSVLQSSDWPTIVEELKARRIAGVGGPYRLSPTKDWSGLKLFTQQGLSDAHRVLEEVKRPVRGISLGTEASTMPAAEGLWVRGAKTVKPFGKRTREELLGTETFANWPMHLLGIGWPGTCDTSPPNSFVVGRAESRAWIADVVPDEDGDLLSIAIGWDADEVDPISCALFVRSEIDQAPLLARHFRISDLPGEVAQAKGGAEARDHPWSKRTMDVRVPRGPRGTSWGVSLLAPDGQLLDERPVVRRVERIELSVSIAGADGPAIESVVGDRRPQPTEAERDGAVVAAAELEAETAARAAGRRISTAGELESYLRWRFSARAGELLVLDPYLLAGEPEAVERVFTFLLGLRRPIRALTAKAPECGLAVLRKRGGNLVDVRGLPNGSDTLHDRPWLVGETGVLVGASLNQFLRDESAATTAVDLPFADAAEWRERFARWWSAGRRFT